MNTKRPTPTSDAMLATELNEPTENAETIGDMTPYCVIELLRSLERERDEARRLLQLARGIIDKTLWCAYCGKIGDHQSGWCKQIEVDQLREQLQAANEDADRLADQLGLYAKNFPLTNDDKSALAAHQAIIKGETRQ